MDISIVILNTNDLKYLEECLESLRNCSASRQVEIIVSDNASTDGSIEMMEAKFPEVKILKNKENLGFTRGNNVGIRASHGKYVFLLNSDIKILDGCIDILADYLDRNEKVGLAGPKVLNRDLTLQCSCRKDPTLWNNFCTVTGLAAAFPHSAFFSGEQMFYFKGDRTEDMDILVGCFSAVRRKAMDQVGLLDEQFYMYGDELDWCRRFREGGWRIVYCREAQAIHYGGTSTVRKDPVRFSVLQQNSLLRYWEKYHGFAACLGIRSLLVFRHVSRWSVAFAKYLLRPGGREEAKNRMRAARICLRAIFGAAPEEGHREPAWVQAGAAVK